MTGRTRLSATIGPNAQLRQLWATTGDSRGSVTSSVTDTHHPPTSDQRCAIRSSLPSTPSLASAGSAKTPRSRRRCSAWGNRSGVDATNCNPMTTTSQAEMSSTSHRCRYSPFRPIWYRQSTGRVDHSSQRAVAAQCRFGARSGMSAMKVIAPTSQPSGTANSR